MPFHYLINTFNFVFPTGKGNTSLNFPGAKIKNMQKHFVSSKDESVRMFRNDLLESLSKVHPSVPLILYLPVIAFFLYKSIHTLHIPYISIFGLFILGIAVWTLTEYVLHRFVFHYQLKGSIGERIHFVFHGVHHDYPNDSRRLVMPPSISIPLALGFFLLFRAMLGPVTVGPFFVGFLSGYLVYDLSHYAIHHFNFKARVWQAMKQHHMRHHFQDPKHGFGVSSVLWDHLFRTTFPRKS